MSELERSIRARRTEQKEADKLAQQQAQQRTDQAAAEERSKEPARQRRLAEFKGLMKDNGIAPLPVYKIETLYSGGQWGTSRVASVDLLGYGWLLHPSQTCRCYDTETDHTWSAQTILTDGRLLPTSDIQTTRSLKLTWKGIRECPHIRTIYSFNGNYDRRISDLASDRDFDRFAGYVGEMLARYARGERIHRPTVG